MEWRCFVVFFKRESKTFLLMMGLESWTFFLPPKKTWLCDINLHLDTNTAFFAGKTFTWVVWSGCAWGLKVESFRKMRWVDMRHDFSCVALCSMGIGFREEVEAMWDEVKIFSQRGLRGSYPFLIQNTECLLNFWRRPITVTSTYLKLNSPLKWDDIDCRTLENSQSSIAIKCSSAHGARVRSPKKSHTFSHALYPPLPLKILRHT